MALARPFSGSNRWITTIDSHTAGHPTRVVTGGLPPIPGGTVAERCETFRSHYDDLRTFLLHEPRGHSAMVGVVMVESAVADFGAFFLASYKYLEMCGHATIGLAVTLYHLGLIGPDENGKAEFTLEVPAGVIALAVDFDDDRISGVSFDNVPAFVAAESVAVAAPSGEIAADIVYGGNWYAVVPAEAAGVTLEPSGVGRAMEIGAAIKQDLNAKIAEDTVAGVSRPVDSVLFFAESEEAGRLVNRQLVVLESNKFDRSPCGTGTSARLAQLIRRGRLQVGETIRSRNILGVDFEATALADASLPDGRIRPRIRGLAHITGMHGFVLTEGDPLASGFLCR
ncbi:Proline racemase [Hartmannibacter diazotrophicus]|uniref:4-hydroxyproline epimerase n=1 Tax=Hartmannibacter diazotrophicus TaxID=1482074 RepID=A0A2C9D282_9HYPH|nr:proline racemase family protein [Hartmannibacter diazotrophicus]SON54356.1 Proline racemase [Hartmannibacter diazotrophicus]